MEDVRREISILHHLGDHPNVVELIDAYEGSKHIYIVMELCKGGELFDRMREEGLLDLAARPQPPAHAVADALIAAGYGGAP